MRKIRCWWFWANDKVVWSLENLSEPKRNNETCRNLYRKIDMCSRKGKLPQKTLNE